MGYKEAADNIVSYILNNHIYPDYLIYPIVFLYRHYLELQLKLIIRNGNKYGYKLLNKLKEYGNCHDINKLWKECRNISLLKWPDLPIGSINAIKACINEFWEIDKSSTSFRYPFRLDGEHSLPDLTHIDIINFSRTMKSIEIFLVWDCDSISFDLEETKINDY